MHARCSSEGSTAEKVSLSDSLPEGGPMSTTASNSSSKSVADILRSVPDENAFYFYVGEGSPSGLKATSLREFLAQVEIADPGSLVFHAHRGDFENWVRMLGDPTLAKQLGTVSSQDLSPEEMKMKMLRIIRMRVGKLRKLAHVPE
jgi:hypothetical protein